MRENLIEAVGSFKFPIESCGCTIGEYIVPYSIQEPLVDHLIASGVVVSKMETTTKWIPVTERLPQGANGKSVCKNVIAYTIDGQVVPGWLNGAYWYLLLQDDTYFTRLERDCVTHWMPLPEPPKGE